MSQYPPPNDPLPPLPPQGQPAQPAQPGPDGRHPGYPTQPAPDGRHPGYPAQPGQDGRHPGYPPQPGQSGGQGGPPKKGLGTGAILAIIGGALAVLIVFVIVIALVVSHVVNSASGDGSGSGGGEAAGSPTETVDGFFAALADGDAETALGYLGDAPDNDLLLTDEVLAASNELAPITDVVTTDETEDSLSGDVSVSYLLGDTPVSASYNVVDYDGDGEWELTGGLGYLDPTRFDGLGLTVNGQAVDTTDQLEIFPGTYELATSLPNFTLTGTTTLAATEPFATLDTFDVEPALSEAALGQFRSLVQSAVDACIASTTLAAGCGLDLPATLDDGTQLAEGTISRSISADATVTIQSMVPTLSYDNPTLAQGEYIGSVSTTGQCTQGGATGTCDVLFGPSLGTPSIDMASENPTVLWD